ncbi:MAG: sigma-70 family RNA polymerase sigma factor [Polyangiaceae bacterium]
MGRHVADDLHDATPGKRASVRTEEALQSGVRRRIPSSPGSSPSPSSRGRDSMDRYLADLDRADRISPEQEVALARAFAEATAECLVVAHRHRLALEVQPGPSPRDATVRCAIRLWRMLDEHAEAVSDPRRGALARMVEEELGADAEALSQVRRAMQETRSEAFRLRGVMTRANLALVVHIAKSYTGRGVPLADLIQDGNIALMHAVELFDPERGTRLSTYASAWLQRAMLRSVRSLSRTVRLPESARNARSDSVPIDEPFGEARLSLTDMLIAPDAIAPDDEAAREQIRARAREMLDQLKPQEAFVVRRRFGIDHDAALTLQEIGDELGITRERVRQIEKAALDKLKRRMRPLEPT